MFMQKEMVNGICKKVIDSVASEVEIIDGQAYVPFDKVSQAICRYFAEDSVQKELQAKQRYYFNYIRKIMQVKDFSYINEAKIKDFVDLYVFDDETFETVKTELSISKNWSMFWERIENKFEVDF